jgi:hypothetical protein
MVCEIQGDSLEMQDRLIGGSPLSWLLVLCDAITGRPHMLRFGICMFVPYLIPPFLDSLHALSVFL